MCMRARTSKELGNVALKEGMWHVICILYNGVVSAKILTKEMGADIVHGCLIYN